MPSLSLLRRGSKQHDQQPLAVQRPQTSPRKEDGSGLQLSAGTGTETLAGSGSGSGTGERERKSSKRDFFGGLLGRSRGRTTTSSPATSGRGTGAESPTKLPVSAHSACSLTRGLFLSLSFHSDYLLSALRIPTVHEPVVLFPTFLWFCWSPPPTRQGP
ncbi:uncharacterized protein CTRU02_207430 [Colletotrichum truncatum]|uniref:Uncharacterized protein n=1 Tax=Colletotrichum truncatum TaxID=5467 RepID=A0ACC3Z0U0_COLTU|nr:uncharacterized protein CTRU02_00937 [Colletotrichum truncatum]KAF6800532.1 hypothetical protein CTRU02_00937 [Colletotrichum truncatum]